MKKITKFLKRQWRNIGFGLLGLLATLLLSTVLGLLTFAYYFSVVVPFEQKMLP